ncbi:MAG TPA: thiamine pyrophosphate-dependent dehydrogenase E1 component subunit alpha [Terriglobia bacterium]|nr:thiamine pyrophosphate-dependent dehydrogenase E1 component subunit alpha [Terriglobia bacterium]
MSTVAATKKSRKAAGPDSATLERMLYYLKLTRESEYRIERVLYRQGKIVGGVYVGRGQEAIGVGSAIQLVAGDVALPSHRDFSSFVIRGVPLGQIFANWMGRATGPTRGRDNTLHIGDLKLGLIPIISPLGDTLPVACGVALTFKQRRRKNVVLVHFGEGTTSRGDVHEAMNLAAVMKLAVVFICNNNAYAYSTPTERQYAVRDLSVRGPAYGMPGVSIDGNDVLAVYGAVQKAIALGRSGDAPSFIECKTFRMTGHSAHDAAEYVPKKLLEQEARRDPILRLEKVMLARKLLTREGIVEMERRIHKEIDEAVAHAESQPMPEGATAVKGVYCGPNCWWKS